MGIELEDIQFVARKIVMVSIKYCYGLVQKYPLVSGALLFFSILYVFFPTIFKIITYASLVLVCFVAYFRFYVPSDHPKGQLAKENKQERHRISPKECRTEDSGSTGEVLIVVNRGNRSFVLRQTSRRRLVKEKNKAWDAESLNVDKDHVSLEDGREDLSAGTNLIEESPEETEAENSLSSNVPDYDGVERQPEYTSLANPGPLEVISDSAQSKPDIVINDGSTEETENTSLDIGEINRRNSEEMRGDGNKPVESTEEEQRSLTDSAQSMPNVSTEQPFNTKATVDQRDAKSLKEVPGGAKNTVELSDNNQENVMDLGESELERNRRLESLMAKRKARRLFRLAVEKNLNDTRRSPSDQIAPIHVSRFNHLEFPGTSDDSSIPGSAPSVLLPARNPFDLPYDPSEEKPNLTEDSFQQEFLVPKHKEVFCRHESFSLGTSFPLESDHDQRSSKFARFCDADKRVDRLGFSRFRTGSGEEDELVQLLTQENDPGSHTTRATDCNPREGRVPTTLKSESEENRHVCICNRDVKEDEMENTHDEGSKDPVEADLIGENTNKLSSSSSEEADGFVQGNKIRDQTDSNDETTNKLSTSSSEENEGFIRDNTSQYQVETDLTDRNNSSSSEEDEEFYSGRRAILSSAIKVPDDFSNAVQKSLAWSMPRKTVGRPPASDSSLSNDRRFMEDPLYYEDRGPCHTPSYSIASDLVVEVSEVGSPPSTIDESHPNSDEESSRYNEIFEQEKCYGSRHSFTASSYPYETKVNNQMGTTQLELSGINRGWEEPPTFFTPREQPSEQDFADIDTFSSSRDDFIRKIHDKVKRVVEESLTKAHHLPQKPGGHNPQEISYGSEKISQEPTADTDVNVPVLRINDNTEDLGSTEDRDNETFRASTTQKDTGGSSALSENIYSDPSNLSDKSAEHSSTNESENVIDLYNTSTSTNLVDGDSQMPSSHNEQSSSKDQLSSVQQHFDGPVGSIKQSQVVSELDSASGTADTEAEHLQNPQFLESANPSWESNEGSSDNNNLDTLKHRTSEVSESDAENPDNSRNSLDTEAVAQPAEQLRDLLQQKSLSELDIREYDGRRVISTEENLKLPGIGESRSSLSPMTDSSLEKTCEFEYNNAENKNVARLSESAREDDSLRNINVIKEHTEPTGYENLRDLLQPFKGNDNVEVNEIIYTELKSSVPEKSNSDASISHKVVPESLMSMKAEVDIVDDNATEAVDHVADTDSNLEPIGKGEDTSGIPEEQVFIEEMQQIHMSGNSHFNGTTGDKFSMTDDETIVGQLEPETKKDS